MTQPLITGIQVGEYQVLTYVVACPETRQGVVIDPAGEEERLAALVRELGVELKYILNTHAHPDHTAWSCSLFHPISQHPRPPGPHPGQRQDQGNLSGPGGLSPGRPGVFRLAGRD